MDLETENRIAAILMREAAELRRQAEKEGTLAYLRQPNVRNRPNSRFLTATVLGVQQANRAVEVKEMWQVRQKELEIDRRLKRPQREASYDRSHRDGDRSGSSRRHPVVNTSITASASCSNTREYEHCPEGLRDEELEDFLHSKIKRGRGAVGPRMDETGPYLPPCPVDDGEPTASPDARDVVYGPEKPPSLKSYESSEEEELRKRREKKAKKSHSGKSDKEYPRKQRSKEKSKHKKKKREEKRSKRGY